MFKLAVLPVLNMCNDNIKQILHIVGYCM